MALLKLDLHLFHEDARKLSLIAVDVETNVTVQHVLQQITSIYEISCEDESSDIALFSEGFFIHPSLPSSALLALPGTLLVRPVRVLPELFLDGKRVKKRRIELLDEDTSVCCQSSSQNNSGLTVLSVGHGCRASSPNARGICCLAGKDIHVHDSSRDNGNRSVLDIGISMQPPEKKRKKCGIDSEVMNHEVNEHLCSTNEIFSIDNELVSDIPTMPKEKGKNKKQKDMPSCDETIEELTVCDNPDRSNGQLSEDEESDRPSKRKSKKKKGMATCGKTVEELTVCDNFDVSNGRMSNDGESDQPPKIKSKKKKKKDIATCDKTVEEITECENLDGSNGRMSEDGESDELPKRKSVKKKNRVNRVSNDVSVRRSARVLEEVDEKYTKMEKSFVENIKSKVLMQENYVETYSMSKSNSTNAAPTSNGTTIQEPYQDDGDVCLQQIEGYYSNELHNSGVVNSRAEPLRNTASESGHCSTSSDDDKSCNETIGTVTASTKKRKRKRKHNKRLKREKRRLKALFLGDGTVEVPVEQQHERQKELQHMEEMYLKRDSAMLATDDKDSEVRLEYEAQLKSVPKLKPNSGKIKIIEGNKFKREKCGIVTFQGKNTTFNSSDVLAHVDEEASVTVSTDSKVSRPSDVMEDVGSGHERIKSTLKGFLNRRLQKTLVKDGPTPLIKSNNNLVTNNQCQSDLQLDLEFQATPKEPIQLLEANEVYSSSPSVNPLVECSRLPSDVLLKSGNRLPTSMAMVRSCLEKSIKSAKQHVLNDDQFSVLRDMENSSEVSVFEYKRRVSAAIHQEGNYSADEFSDSSSDDSIEVSMSMPRRKKTDDGVRFPFRAPPNPTPFSPESDGLRSEFFFLSSIENQVGPLVYHRYNAYGKEVSSVGICKKGDIVNDVPRSVNSTMDCKQTAAIVLNKVNLSMNRPSIISVHNVKPKPNECSISLQNVSVDVTAPKNGATSNDAPLSKAPCCDTSDRNNDSQTILANGIQTFSAQKMYSANEPNCAESIEFLKDSNNLPGDPPCPNSLEKLPSSMTSWAPGEQTPSSLPSHEGDAMAGAASVHTGKRQCLQPISNRHSKVFKPRVYSALGSLLQQLRNKTSTEEKAGAGGLESGGMLNGVKDTVITCRKPRKLTGVTDENIAVNDVHGLESCPDQSNTIDCSNISSYSNGIDRHSDRLSPVSYSTERTNYLSAVSNGNPPKGDKLAVNSKLENIFGNGVLPKKERGKRIRKRKGKDTQKLGSVAIVKCEPFHSNGVVTVTVQSEPFHSNGAVVVTALSEPFHSNEAVSVTAHIESFQSDWDVTPEEYNARHLKNARNTSFVENNIKNPTSDFNSDEPTGLPSVLSNIDVASLPQVQGLPHVGDIVFFYVDDANFTSGDCPTETVPVKFIDAETRGESESSFNGCLTTGDVNALPTCLAIDVGRQLASVPTSNSGLHQLVPMVGKVLTVSEDGEISLQLIGNSSHSATGEHAESLVDLAEYDGTHSSSCVEKTVLWSSVVCPKLVFP